MRIHLPIAILTIVFATGCDRHQEQATTTATPPAETATVVAPPPEAKPEPTAAPRPSERVEVQIASVANTMTFDKTKLSVPAGAEVHLTFKNNSNVSTLPHNWVLVKPGTEASVAAAGLKLGEQAGYFDVRDKDVLAHTPMAKPGESTEVTFTAPSDSGDYPYICTIPGHYMMMKGVLTVTPGAS